jgi:hypothetical protein
MYLKGRVAFVGSSSMLVRCQVGYTAPVPAAAATNEDDGAAAAAMADSAPLLVADFLYVARDRATGRAAKVNTGSVLQNRNRVRRPKALARQLRAVLSLSLSSLNVFSSSFSTFTSSLPPSPFFPLFWRSFIFLVAGVVR